MNYLHKKRQNPRISLFRTLLAAGLALFASIAFAIPETKDTLCNAVPEALAIASKIRGLNPKGPVSCRVQNKDEVRGFILEQVNTKIPAERLRLEEGVFKTVGLLPPDYNYKEGLLDLYSEQIGGYYDPESKQFTMASWMPLSSQFTVAVHELTHALQDQYFGIGKFQDYTKLTTDEQLAASALIEGDATAVMIDEKMPPPGIAGLGSVDAIVAAQAMGAALMIQGKRPVPESLRMLIIFPYSEGLRLAHALLRSGGYSKIDGAFSRMPKTTKEILSPANYLNGFVAESFPPHSECLRTPEGCATIHSDSLGEFLLRTTLISNQISSIKAQRLAASWSGDKLEVIKIKGEEHVLWRISFAAPEAAKAFAKELSEIKFKMSVAISGKLVTLRAPLTNS